MTSPRTHTLASLLVLSLALPAWLSASLVAGARSPAVKPLPNRPVAPTVRVWNDHAQAVNVMLLNGTDEYLLGEVKGSAIRSFRVPANWVGAANASILVTPAYDKSVDIGEEFQTAPIQLPAADEANVYVDSHGAYATLNGRSNLKGLADRAATLRVTNDGRQAVNIVLLGDRGEYMLGGVQAKTTRVFQVPNDLLGIPDVRVTATGYPNRPDDASDDFQSGNIEFDAGHGAWLLVPGPVSASAITLN